MTVSETHHRKYHRLARGPFHEPVVAVMRAYLAAAVDTPEATAREHWSLSCLPGTTPWRLSSLTMRTMDMVVVNKPRPGEDGVQALMFVEASTLDEGFGGRAAASAALSALDIEDSDYYEAGPDQALVHGGWPALVAALGHPVVAGSVHAIAARMMAKGRALHWRGHNPLLVADVLQSR